MLRLTHCIADEFVHQDNPRIEDREAAADNGGPDAAHTCDELLFGTGVYRSMRGRMREAIAGDGENKKAGGGRAVQIIEEWDRVGGDGVGVSINRKSEAEPLLF